MMLSSYWFFDNNNSVVALNLSAEQDENIKNKI